MYNVGGFNITYIIVKISVDNVIHGTYIGRAI